MHLKESRAKTSPFSAAKCTVLPAHLLPTKPASLKVILGPASTLNGSTEHQQYETRYGPYSRNLQFMDQSAQGQLITTKTEGRHVFKDTRPREVLAPDALKWSKGPQKTHVRRIWGWCPEALPPILAVPSWRQSFQRESTVCSNFRPPKTSHGGRLGLQPLPLSPAERQQGPRKLPLPWADRQGLPPRAQLACRVGLGKGRGAGDGGDRLKGIAWGGTRRVPQGAALLRGRRGAPALGSTAPVPFSQPGLL